MQKNEQWERFTEKVDYVVPLPMRRVIPTQTDCNWVESYFLCLCQFRVIKGVLYYEWLDDLGIWSLRLFVPKSLRRKVIEGCHDPPFSAHQGERKTLQRVKRSSFGMA